RSNIICLLGDPKTLSFLIGIMNGMCLKLEDQTKKLHKDMKKSTEADLAMSKAAVKISVDLLSNPLCEQDQAFLEAMSALDTAMKRMDSFNQEKVRLSPKFDIVLCKIQQSSTRLVDKCTLWLDWLLAFLFILALLAYSTEHG
uniref:Uncharacterized protein n=1 Tax=Oryzias sinensis TaxID=183150 RepID=A0A8C7WPD4_9TELE